MARSKVKSWSDHDIASVHLLTNVPTKYQLPTLLDPWTDKFWNTVQGCCALETAYLQRLSAIKIQYRAEQNGICDELFVLYYKNTKAYAKIQTKKH